VLENGFLWCVALRYWLLGLQRFEGYVTCARESVSKWTNKETTFLVVGPVDLFVETFLDLHFQFRNVRWSACDVSTADPLQSEYEQGLTQLFVFQIVRVDHLFIRCYIGPNWHVVPKVRALVLRTAAGTVPTAVCKTARSKHTCHDLPTSFSLSVRLHSLRSDPGARDIARC
jgi:hypothetical protein